ncbi:hypothetical protein ACWCXK_20990 [Streptomyces sp. NPDC001739]|uniref:hypothetical protein n=1 Tax=Streptomyces sp. C184 TaxID=3237121 RepID=UPI0034C643D8
MGQPHEHVNFDFGAADRLSHVLTQAQHRVSTFIDQRGKRRSHLLGDPDSDNWAGTRREANETQFTSQQRALTELLTNIGRLKSAVDNAKDQAWAVNSHANQEGGGHG